jgi:Uma2 family endonuclease
MTTAQRLTFADYLIWSQHTDQRYELIDGRPVELPPESEPNVSLANYLFLQLVNAGVPFRLVQPHSCEIQVPVLQPGDAANRYPDLVILSDDHIPLTSRRLTITFDMVPPPVVMEVVSPGDRNRQQYAARGIPEYWLIDPNEQVIVLLRLEQGRYAILEQLKENDPVR